MHKDQIFLINNIKRFLLKFTDKSKFPYRNSIFYLSTNSDLSLYLLNSLGRLQLMGFFIKFRIIFRNILYILKYINPVIIAPVKNFFYNRIILTWAFEENFSKDGSLNDRYFNINSKNLPETLWLVIFMGKKLPKKINQNIFIISKSKRTSLNLFKIIKVLLSNILYFFLNLKYYLALVSSDNYLADYIINKFTFLFNDNVKFFLLPYEGQVFQNKLISNLKMNKKIKVIGYVHSPPMAMPSNFIFRSGSPDIAVLNGIDQKFCFKNFLGWKNKNIKVLPSFRFIKNSKNFKNTIFLPISILNPVPLLKRMENLHNNKIIDLKKFNVRGHPAVRSSLKNILLIRKINKFIKNLPVKSKFKYKGNFLIFIGISGAIIEELEKGSNVIQLSENPIFDTYSNKLYPSLIKKKIDDNVFTYKLKNKGNLLKFGNKKKNLRYIISL